MIKQLFSALPLAFALAAPAPAASLERITTDGALGNISFQHLEQNAAGDFVGVSNARVFAGNVQDKRVSQIMAVDNTDFVLTASTTFQADGAGQINVTVDFDLLGTRLALNAQGDFVLASNTRLFVGNARMGQVREVANAGAFADFQAVAINDAGHYAAISSKKIFGGKVTDARAQPLVADAVGIFDVTELYAFQNSVSGSAGDRRLALNQAGQFVAATRSAVYVGDLAAMTVEKVFEQRGIGFKHVAINGRGELTVVTDQDVFVGSAR